MKNKIVVVSTISILFILLAVLLNKVSKLENRISHISSQISVMESNLRLSVNSVSAQFAEEMKKQSSKISDISYSFIETDIESKTVKTEFNIVLKEYNPALTQMFLVTDDKEYPLSFQNGFYGTVIDIPLFENFGVNYIRITDGVTIYNETAKISVVPGFEVLPSVNAKYRGKCTSVRSKGSHNATYNGQITINVERKGAPVNVKSITMIEFLEGKEISRTDIPLNTKPIVVRDGNKAYAIPENVSTDYNIDWSGSKTYYHQLDNKKVSIPFGNTYSIYIEVTDESGLSYRVCVDTRKISENGMPIDTIVTGITDLEIYNSSTGELLYDAKNNVVYK